MKRSLKDFPKPGRHARGYTLIELSVGIFLTLILLYMVVPSNRNQEKTLGSKATAEELVARLRRARETARSKGVPVALAIPATSAVAYSDTAFQLEGDINPEVTSFWKIEQKFHETVFFTGEWPGLSWTAGTTSSNSSYRFDLANWWTGTPPPLRCVVFLPTGEAVSSTRLGDGQYRIVVAQGLAPSANTLLQATNPWTVSITPAGETSLTKGVVGGAAIVSSGQTETPTGASYTPPAAGTNRAPVNAGAGNAGVFAFPDTDNPAGTGKIVDLEGVLTLEVRVRDADGDPPYFEWETRAARSPANVAYSDMDVWGGRFSNTGEVRMEWDATQREWVGRTTWSPASGDAGGNSYQLVCNIRDRKGGTLTSGFPITGWLETTKEQWVLYRTVGPSGRWELWKMTLQGLNHKRVIAFQGQDVTFGEWGPSGDEVIVAGPHGVFRASADGGNLRQINQAGLAGLTGVSITPKGDKVLYTVGSRENYDIREITLAAGAEVDRKIMDYGGSIDWVYGLKCTEINGEIWGIGTFYRKYTKRLRTRRRRGMMVANVTRGISSSAGSNPVIHGHNANLTGSFAGYDNDTKVIWADRVVGGGRDIIIQDVTVGPPGNGNLVTLGPRQVLTPGQTAINFPRITYDGVGCVYTSGLGAASQIWYMPDITSPTNVTRLPLSPLNTGGRDVSISIPR